MGAEPVQVLAEEGLDHGVIALGPDHGPRIGLRDQVQPHRAAGFIPAHFSTHFTANLPARG